MTTPRRLTEHEALAAIAQEPRPSPLWMDAVIDEDAAEVAYEASIHARDDGSWWEYGQKYDTNEWGVLLCEVTNYESDTNAWNWKEVPYTFEPCPSKHIARALATARNRGEPDPFLPAD